MKKLAFLALSILLLSMTFSRGYTQVNFETGKIMDSVKCISDERQSYALYLPSGFEKDRQWPVIYIFDPAARGRLPVERFKPVADKFGYMLVCSNNSKNAPWDFILKAADAMLKDTQERFSINMDRVYTSGFSGGSRAATAVAVITKKVKGVIACGAGFPNVKEYQPTRGDGFLYVSLVGDKDMNYLEHKQVEKELTALGITNRRIVFAGKHLWPPTKKLYAAVFWLELQEHDVGGGLIDEGYSYFLKLAKVYEGDGNLLAAKKAYEEIKQDFANQDLKVVDEALERLQSSKSFKKLTRNRVKLEKRESKLQSIYFEAFSQMHVTMFKPINDSTAKDEKWWKGQIDILKRMANNKNKEVAQMSQRLLNLVWAHFAESSFKYANQGDFEMAWTLTSLWVYAEPKSLWANWSMATLYAKQGKRKDTLDTLKYAIRLGITKKESLLRESSFDFLHDDPDFEKLVFEVGEKP